MQDGDDSRKRNPKMRAETPKADAIYPSGPFSFAGCDAAKQIIRRRVVFPAAEPNEKRTPALLRHV
jgi:hypothetical protein